MIALLPWEPELAAMLGVVTTLFFGMKGLVWTHWRREEASGPLRPGRFAAFLAPWPGMNPAVFRRRGGPRPAWWREGARALLAGLLLLTLAHRLRAAGCERWALVPLVGLGFMLFLHFGLFAWVAAAYRAAGVPVARPFGNPLTAPSLRAFWGHRWNRPFMELTTMLIFRRARRARAGIGPRLRRRGVIAAFLFSGLLHEAAITVPVGEGYGGPTFYFLLQAAGWLAEEAILPARFRRGWLWGVVLVPLPLLFPAAFWFRVMFPLAGLEP